MIRPIISGLAALLVVACTTMPNDAPVGQAPPDIEGQSLAAELIRRDQPGPPSTVPGECWAHETLPAVIETVTEHRQISPKTDTSPAVFSTATHQRIVQDRRTVWFRTPCPADMTPDFIASLQRAMKARGLYGAPLTGQMDTLTRQALRHYQAPLGLDSDTLSFGAAQQLGLITYDLYRLKNGLDRAAT